MPAIGNGLGRDGELEVRQAREDDIEYGLHPGLGQQAAETEVLDRIAATEVALLPLAEVLPVTL